MLRLNKSILLFITLLFTVVITNVQAAKLVIAGRDGGYGKALQQTIDAYQKMNPGVEIELLKLPYGSLYEKLVISLREKTGSYGLVMLDDTWATEFMGNGWLADITETGPIDSDFIDKTIAISSHPFGSKNTYALPFVGNVAMFAYRKDLIDKYGLSVSSWTNVLNAVETIHAKESGVSGVVYRGVKANPIVTGFLAIFWAHGGQILNDQGKAAVNSPEGVAALEYYLKLKNFAPRGIVNYNSSEVKDALYQGKAGIAIEVWPGWVPGMDDPSISKVVNKMEIMAAPGEVKGPSPMLGIWLFGIPSDAPDAKVSRDFLDFLLSAENQKTMALEVGTPPTRTSVYTDSEVIKKYRWYPAQLKALQNGKPRPRTKKWKQIESVLGDYLQLALIGQMSAQDAMDRANKDIDKALR